MNANAAAVLAIFEKKHRLEVPLFQRQYVWNKDAQWEPLWDDLTRKFSEHLDGRKDAPVHFLGAMVLDQKQTPTTHVERRQVIDGQQRLTTLQIFLAAFRDLCQEQGVTDLASECDSFILNTGMMGKDTIKSVDGKEWKVDQFKVWPTQLDRANFTTVLTAGSRAAVEKAYPLHRKKYAQKYDPRPRIVEAYLFFHEQLSEYFLGHNGEPPLAADKPLSERLETCFSALKNTLRVVVIDLERDDDAQVIFETLNARGEPLLPADLLRNYIFLRAARVGEDQEKLYEQYWRRFDDTFWRQEVKQGRLLRPRSDLFIQHFLASKQTYDIPIKHLYVEYKHWIEHDRPYATITDELAAIARQGDDFRRIISPAKDDPLYPLSTFLDVYDVRTAYPLLLHLLDQPLTVDDWQRIATTIESYVLRRAILGLPTKNYNRVFLTLTRTLRKEGTTPEKVVAYFQGLTGESTVWPTDDTFSNAWLTTHAYHLLNNPKIVHILQRLNQTYLTTKQEQLSFDGQLSVEHLMPQSWQEHWPLQDGSNGMAYTELLAAAPDDTRAIATKNRDGILHTFGNLTILTQALNSSLSKSAWTTKKPALLAASLLPVNQSFNQYDHWDETAIAARGQELLKRALTIWPRPQ